MSENIQRRIQALLERAMHSATPEHEREACQEKAESLMEQHRFERAMFNFSAEAKDVKRNIVTREYGKIHTVNGEAVLGSKQRSYEWEIESKINSLRNDVFRHAGCKMSYRSGTQEEHWESILVVVGYEEDLFFGELLWNTIFLHLADQLFGAWSDGKTFDQNVYDLKKQGYNWPQVCTMGLNASAKDSRGALTQANSGSKLRSAYRREAKRRGEEVLPGRQQPANASWWRLSFITAYDTRIYQRFTAMKAGHDEYRGVDNLPAFQADEDAVNQKFWELFPSLHPEERARRAAEYEEAHKNDPPPKAVRQKKIKTKYLDMNAYDAGHNSANSVNLTNNTTIKNKEALS